MALWGKAADPTEDHRVGDYMDWTNKAWSENNQYIILNYNNPNQTIEHWTQTARDILLAQHRGAFMQHLSSLKMPMFDRIGKSWCRHWSHHFPVILSTVACSMVLNHVACPNISATTDVANPRDYLVMIYRLTVPGRHRDFGTVNRTDPHVTMVIRHVATSQWQHITISMLHWSVITVYVIR